MFVIVEERDFMRSKRGEMAGAVDIVGSSYKMVGSSHGK